MKNKNGKYTEDLENGMKLEVEYNNGKKNGKETYWYDNGHKASEGFWKNDKLEGKLTAWNETGRVIQEVHFKDDMEHGLCTIWNDKGQMESEQMFKEGRPFGKLTIYEDGIKIKEGIANYPKGDSPHNRGSDYSVN